MTWVFSGLDGTVDTTVVPSTGVVQRTFRDPFGVPLGGASGVWGDGTGFLGKPVTASSKLTTVGARTYDPVLGKFTSVDPVVDPRRPEQNLGYAYSSNNPITFSDPTGLIIDDGCGGWHVVCGSHASAPTTWQPVQMPPPPVVRTAPPVDNCSYAGIGCLTPADGLSLPQQAVLDRQAELLLEKWTEQLQNIPRAKIDEDHRSMRKADADRLAQLILAAQSESRCERAQNKLNVCHVEVWVEQLLATTTSPRIRLRMS